MGVSITTCRYWCAAIFSPQLVGLWINIVHLKIAHTAEYKYDITQEVVCTQVWVCGGVGVDGGECVALGNSEIHMYMYIVVCGSVCYRSSDIPFSLRFIRVQYFTSLSSSKEGGKEEERERGEEGREKMEEEGGHLTMHVYRGRPCNKEKLYMYIHT